MHLTPAITPQELAQVDVNRLPTQAKIIINLIGIEKAWTLLSDRGGREIKIPAGDRSDTYLHQLITPTSAEALIQRFAGTRLTLPKTDKIVTQIRNRRIYQAKAQGEPMGHLVARFHLTRRSIILICTRIEAGNRV